MYIRACAIAVIFVCLSVCAWGKNLYVSTTGSDSTTYAVNDIDHPWLTVEKAVTSVEPGDTVYFRAGSYEIASTIDTISNTNPISESERVVFQNYDGETVNIATTFDSSTAESTAAIRVDRDYYSFTGLNLEAAGTFFYFGYTSSADYGYIDSCNIYISVYGGSPNLGCIRYQVDRAIGGRVTNCVLHGPGVGDFSSTRNTAGVFAFRSQGLVIENNEFYDLPRAIFFKHTCVGYDTGISVKNNYIYNVGEGIVWVGQYADISNNIIYARSNGIKVGEDGGAGDDGTNIGGDFNDIQHNTVILYDTYNSDSAPIYFLKATADPDGPIGNVVKNNIFATEEVNYAKYQAFNPFSSGGGSDYNLYLNTSACIYHYITSSTLYSLSNWRSLYSLDSNSIGGSPTFSGGGTFSAITDYTLTSESLGYQAADDGDDMGADVSLVGVSAGASTTRYYLDTDGDGYSPGDYQDAESDPGETWYTEAELTSIVLVDCDDSDVAINPGATEVCGNEVDDNCNGQTDEGCATTMTTIGNVIIQRVIFE